MSGGPVRVLVVDDNPDDATLIELELSNGGYEPHISRVQTAETMRAALDHEPWDIVLSDYTMPKFNALEALDVLKATGKDIPFIMISGSVGEELAVRAMKAGAHDYFMKGDLGLLVSAIRRELREAEHRRISRRQREQLLQNEKLVAMGTLLAGIAHELNNPLAVIVGQAALLQKALKDDPRQERSEKIVQAAERCTRIIKNFLALARQQPPHRVNLSINDVVRETVELFAYGLRIDNVDVHLELAENLPTVSADPHQLQQVLINLVTNAHHALLSRKGTRVLTLRTDVDPQRDGVILQVKDTGGGIPPDIRARIFEPFFTTKADGEGTGLGLALCHSIVSSHGGTISVDSEVDVGTTFTIDMPSGAQSSSKHPVAIEGEHALGMKRILVVDDEPEVASVLSDVLTFQGHHVDVAPDGKTALQLLDKITYDLVISDMRMPGMDGPALYRETVARYPFLARRFVFLTGDVFRPETDQFLKEAQAVYLSKPCTFDEIVSAVQQAFS